MSDTLSDWSFRRSLRSSLGNVRYAMAFPSFLRSWLRIWNEYDLAALIRSGTVPFVCNKKDLGDNFLLTAFAGEYCKTYGLTGVVVLAPSSQVALLQRLPGVIRAIAMDARVPANRKFATWLAQMPPFSRCVVTSGVLQFGQMRQEARVFPEMFAIGLGMPARTKPALAPLPSHEELRRATTLLESKELRPGHVVLLAPGSNWSNRTYVTDESWRVLARVAQEHGWSVAQNLLGCVTRIPGTVGLEIPLEDLVAVSCACGWVIAQRTGLCDVVAGRIPKLTVLYSPRRRGDSLDRFESLVDSGQDPHADELFLDDDLDEMKAQVLMGVRDGS